MSLNIYRKATTCFDSEVLAFVLCFVLLFVVFLSRTVTLACSFYPFGCFSFFIFDCQFIFAHFFFFFLLKQSLRIRYVVGVFTSDRLVEIHLLNFLEAVWNVSGQVSGVHIVMNLSDNMVNEMKLPSTKLIYLTELN